MQRIALLILIASFIGCAHGSRPEEVDGMDLEQQMEVYIDSYVNDVLDLCIEMHGKAQAGQSTVDCAFSGDLKAMHLSFPSIVWHNEHYYPHIARLEHHWCAAAQAKTGEQAHWVRHFRREKRIAPRPCHKGEQLRRLLQHAEEREARTR